MISARLAPLVLAAALLAGCGGSHTAAPSPVTSPAPSSAASQVGAPAVPATGAYLGVWVNPGHEKPFGSSVAELAQLPGFETATTTRPAILSDYVPWASPAPVAALHQIAAEGAVPMLSWRCESTAAIAGGSQDAAIRAYATALKAYGGPVLLRWFWEMNLHTPTASACLGDGGAAGYVTAWRHIRAIFQEVGASNVAFVWCPGLSAGLASMTPFYPGAGAVDWIAVDGYATNGGADFGRLFGGWYAAWQGEGRPLMVAETGADPAEQAAFLASVGRELPGRFPQLKAVDYFDAPGDRGAWQLSAAGQAAFRALADQPYFTARSGVTG